MLWAYSGFSTQIILFLEMLKFSQIVFLKRPIFLVKENQESFEMFWNILNFFWKWNPQIQLIIGYTCAEATLVLQIFTEYSKPFNFLAIMFFTWFMVPRVTLLTFDVSKCHQQPSSIYSMFCATNTWKNMHLVFGER
jgi:hypothetical protein